MNTVELINQYDELIDRIGEDIKKSPYKTQFFLDILNIKRGFFYKKIKEKKFTSEEVKKLSKYLYPVENESYEVKLITRLIEKSRSQIKNGEVEDFEMILKETKQENDL